VQKKNQDVSFRQLPVFSELRKQVPMQVSDQMLNSVIMKVSPTFQLDNLKISLIQYEIAQKMEKMKELEQKCVDFDFDVLDANGDNQLSFEEVMAIF
jgi:hypothetical protein